MPKHTIHQTYRHPWGVRLPSRAVQPAPLGFAFGDLAPLFIVVGLFALWLAGHG